MTIEREPYIFTDKIRQFSRDIVKVSTDILTIDHDLLKSDFIGRLKAFSDTPKQGPNPFADEFLSPDNELGLNLFLNVVNFCYRDPFTKTDYKYANKAGDIIPRAAGLKAAMAESDINWGNIREVSEMTPDKWASIIQLANNPNFYLGTERGRRISEFAGYISGWTFGHAESVSHLVSSLDFDTNLFLSFLSYSGFFTDRFEKRSQLAVNMMDGVLKRRFGKFFVGTQNLTVMADYRLPQLAYNLDVIQLSPALKEVLVHEEILESESREEVALRAATIVIGEEIAIQMKLTEGEVDTIMWSMATSMAKSNQLSIPHMIVATDKY
jgi:hypothetical protein